MTTPKTALITGVTGVTGVTGQDGAYLAEFPLKKGVLAPLGCQALGEPTTLNERFAH